MVNPNTRSGNFMVKLVCRLSRDSMETDTSNGDCMVKFVLRLSGSSIYHVFSIKAADR